MAIREHDYLHDMSPAQALVLGFLALIVLGTAALCLPVSWADGQRISPPQALFTATSAVCVTGLVVVDTGTAYSRFGQVVILLLFQLGGLGIMLFSTALFAVFGRRLGLRERLLVQQTSPGLSLAGVTHLARHIVLFTLACELVGFLGLWLAWAGRLGAQAPFYALFHSVSAFCNAGFSLWADSLSTDVSNPGVNLLVLALIVVGGLGYMVCRDVLVALGVTAAGLVGVGQLVDQHHGGVAGQSRVQVKLLDGHTAVFETSAGEHLQPFDQGAGLSPAVGLHVPGYHIHPLGLEAVGRLQHGIRLAHPRGIAQEHFQAPGASPPLAHRELFEERIRIGSLSSHP